MGTYLAFTLYSGTLLLTFYIFYLLFAAREKQFKLNRAIIITIYIVSLAAWPIRRIVFGANYYNTESITSHNIDCFEGNYAFTETSPKLITVLIGIYLIGMIATIVLTLINLFKTYRLIKRGYMIAKEGYKLVVLPGENIIPFSFFRYIVIGTTELEENRKYVIEHELAHIRSLHFLDLILAQTICIAFWYNPGAWGMRKELGLLHEFQADAKVLASGANSKEYQMLLIKTVAGKLHHTLINSLHHSNLKYRIAMMQKTSIKSRSRLKTIALAIAPVIAIYALRTPSMAMEIENLRSFEFSQYLKSLQSKERQEESNFTFLDSEGNPMTAPIFISIEKSDKPDENLISIPLNLSNQKGLQFIVNGKLLPKEEEPTIYVNGKKSTGPLDEKDLKQMESFSFRKDSKGRPYGIIDITLKK